MKLPEIAILVSSVSAAITGGNVILTYRTFRRVRPKVKVRVWRTAPPSCGAEPHWQYILRFLNKGLSPVHVERIELYAYKSSNRFSESEFLSGNRFERDTVREPLMVPALDGTTYRFTYDSLTQPGGGRYLRFRVLLTNGRTAITPVISLKSMGHDKIDAGDK